MALLYYAGLRVSEVREIRWEDIDFEREIHVKQPKGEKGRMVFLYKKLKNILKEYGLKNYGYILISARGRSYSERTIQQIVKNVAKKNRYKQKSNATYFETQLCHTLTRGRSRYKIHTGAAGA